MEWRDEVIQERRFRWNDRYLLGFSRMDLIHREFVELVDRLLTAEDNAIPEITRTLINHLEMHFSEEKEWMGQEEYPARDCHVEEHEKVLASAKGVMKLLDSGNIEVCRQFGLALKDWFPGHADYMDSALSNWLVKRNFNGLPLVLKRLNPANDHGS